MNVRSILQKWSWRTYLLFVPAFAVAILVAFTLRHRDYNETFFIYGTYYVLATMLGTYLLVWLSGADESWSPRVWIRSNVPGIVTTALVSSAVFLAVHPAYRVLADEANLVGVSKNLYANRTANFAVTGKWYFENYWNINQVTDRRPSLYPFLVSLLHTLRGYHPQNGFHTNAVIFILFVFASYRLAKSLGGEIFGVAAAILVATSPNTVVAARSAGFDLMSVFLLLALVQSVHSYAKDPTPRALALVALTMCLLMHVRVESMGLVAVSLVMLAAFRIFRWSHLKGYEFVYSLIPVFLALRYWQTLAKANDQEQPLSAKMFGVHHFITNGRDYLGILKHPFDLDTAHSPLLLALGAVGCALLVFRVVRRARVGALPRADLQLALLVSALVAAEIVLTFAYSAGLPLQPASVRLFIWLDTFLAFVAAWVLTALGGRVGVLREKLREWSAPVLTVLVSAGLFVLHLPVAQEARFINALILTREAAQTWAYFESLGDKRILVLTDRPGLYTIMNYGALDISGATSNKQCLYELSRHLYDNIYLVQELDLESKKPLTGFTSWSDVPLQTVLEFQNTESASVRISRVVP